MKRYDAIVLGVGGMGSATLHQLARRGLRVLGIDQFAIGHNRGSSHGETRIIRRAYFEHPDYVPLVDQAFELWRKIEDESGKELLRATGLLLAGPADGQVISGTVRAAQEHNLPIDRIEHQECVRRFGPLTFPEDMSVLFERNAGFLFVDRCVESIARLAQANGAAIQEGCRVERWNENAHGITVFTDQGKFAADQLVITAGAWSQALCASSRLPIEVRRKVVMWFPTHEERYDIDRGFPVFGFEHDGHFIYGFPRLSDERIKIADHTGGVEVIDASAVDRTLHPSDIGRVAAVVRTCLPGVSDQPCDHSVCMYSVTPDEHFILTRAPDCDRVLIAAGFSGHGFKFAPVIGAALSDWVTEGRTDASVDFLRWPRASSS